MRKKTFGSACVAEMRGRSFVENYLRDIRKYKQLTEEREIELSALVKEGNKRAEDEFVKANLRLVVSIANTYGTMMAVEDMIQNGNVGLCIAVRGFEPTCGCRFITYATPIIRKYILMGITDDSRVVRQPANEQGNLTTSESLDENVYDDEDERTKSDLLVGDMGVNSDLDSIATDLARAMRNVLTERERDVLCKVMGIGCRKMFYEEIGNIYGVSGERARQIHQESVAKLKNNEKVAKLLAIYL